MKRNPRPPLVSIDINELYISDKDLTRHRNTDRERITSVNTLFDLVKGRIGHIKGEVGGIKISDLRTLIRGDGFKKGNANNTYQSSILMSDRGAEFLIDFVNGRIQEAWDNADESKDSTVVLGI